MKQINKIRNSQSRILVFDTAMQRNNFVIMYRDLFVPYSKSGEQYSRHKDNEYETKQLLEGYLVNPYTITTESDRLAFLKNKYILLTNMKASDFTKIKEVLKLIKNSLRRGASYWTL